MLLAPDITARLKGLRKKRARGFGSFAERLLRQWALVLCFGALLLLLAAVFSAYRFYYWNHIDEQPPHGSTAASAYSEDQLRAVLATFDARAERSAYVLESAPPPESSIATGTPQMVDGATAATTTDEAVPAEETSATE